MNITRMADMVHEAGSRLPALYPERAAGQHPAVGLSRTQGAQSAGAGAQCAAGAVVRRQAVVYGSVDLAPLLSDADGELRIDLTKDGIHLHPAGYVIWTDYLKKQKYLK